MSSFRHSQGGREAVSISQLADRVLAEVEASERVKVAETAVVREVMPEFTGEISNGLHKLAEQLRSEPTDITYDDLNTYARGAR